MEDTSGSTTTALLIVARKSRTTMLIPTCQGFAFLTGLASGLVLFLSVVLGEYAIAGVVRLTYTTMRDPNYLRKDIDNMNSYVGELAISLIFLVVVNISMIFFMFSVVLYYGISKRHLGLIKAYLIFGVCFAFLVFSTTMYHRQRNPDTISAYVLGGCVFYMTSLVTIREAYKHIVALQTLDRASSSEV